MTDMKIVKLLQVSLIFIVSVENVSCLRCYECDSTTNFKCTTPFRKKQNRLYLKECDMKIYYYCIKIVQEVQGNMHTRRVCETKSLVKKKKYCDPVTRIHEQGKASPSTPNLLLCEWCDTDGCNAASQRSHAPLTLLITAVASYFCPWVRVCCIT